MYNLIEYSDNYLDTSGSLWQFKRDESYMNNLGSPTDVATLNYSSVIWGLLAQMGSGFSKF